jgi:2-oxoglutarate dehydrogenase E2 component (dihydrolipoamide succinyltransferase)
MWRSAVQAAATATTSAARRGGLQVSGARSFAVVTVSVPSMGDSISEGTLVSVAKAAGEQVAADEVVVVLETDKVCHVECDAI